MEQWFYEFRRRKKQSFKHFPLRENIAKFYLMLSLNVLQELVLDHSKDIFLLDNDLPCGEFMFQVILPN